ncbi:MAG: hypothetical protein PHD01_04575 [Geobacteraceae bacterium]|nr:hypothetical protein [Geobacteraceae bacterium]
MDLNHAELHAACYITAKKTMMDARPTDVQRIKKLADTFYTLCLEHIGRVKALGRDPNIVVRAVKYLADTHAIQPMHDSTEWFFFMLRALLELACPEKVNNRDSLVFFTDIEEGLAQACCQIEDK